MKMHRQGLARVPSCYKHNLDNSREVEYVRNIVSLSDGINNYGTTIAKTLTVASFLRNRKSFYRTFRGAADANVNGREVVLFKAQISEIKRVMEAIGYALYYQDHQQRFPYKWNCYGTSMRSRAEFRGDVNNPRLRQMLVALVDVPMQTIHPQAFRYAVYAERDYRIIYKLEFYDGFIVHLMGRDELNE